ncbi:MAG: SsrA-binding protein [Patescibacteria group bacterium]
MFKLEVGLARGKKKWDKREAIKKKDQLRDVENALKGDVRIDGNVL